MKTGYKILLGLGGAVSLALLFSSFKSDKKSTTSTAPSSSPNGKASNDQFDSLVETAKDKGSDMFEGATGSELTRMRSTFTSNLSESEAETILTLINRKESDWKASDKINFDAIMKKWRGTVTSSTPKPVLTNTPPTASAPSKVAYSPETDKDYDAKMPILTKWYDHMKEENKKRIIPRVAPSKNKFMEQFLPWALNDLTTYVALVYKGDKGRDTKDLSIMKKLKTKYIKSFRGSDVLYTNFAGSNVVLQNLS
jgi:hypothetical protein